MAIDTQSRVIVRTFDGLENALSFIFHQGGTSSGKTFGVLYALILFAFHSLKKGGIISVVSENLPHLKRGAITDFESILIETGLDGKVKANKSTHTWYLPDKKKIEFFAVDNEAKAKSGKRDILFINEANHVNWAIANQLMMRTRQTVILDWNPSGKFWLHRMLLPSLDGKDYRFTRTTYKDNKFADKKIIEGIERLKLIDSTLYEVYGMGIEGYGTEIIYTNWELVDAFPDGAINIFYGLDFGYTNHPAAGIRGAYFDGALWWDELFYERGMKNSMINDAFRSCGHFITQICADSAEPKSCDELTAMGLPVIKAVKGPDSVKFGIDRVKEYPEKITKRSLNLIDEQESYKWEMKDGVPTNVPKKGQQDHLMDAKRYCAQLLLAKHVPLKMQRSRPVKMGFNDWEI